MATVKSFAELNKLLKKRIESAMKNEVSEIAKDVMVDSIVKEVYNEYTPTAYDRRYDQGGLVDEGNIETMMINDSTLQIKNITKDDIAGRYITPIIEHGIGYTWVNSEIYQNQPFPRPFIEITANELKKGKAKKALKEGLKRQGIKCE